MRSERVSARNTMKRAGWTLLAGMVLLAASPLAGQSSRTNFFVAVKGPTWGPDRPAVSAADTHCHDMAYSEGMGHLTWHVYLNGTSEHGEEGQIARARIGEGPWYNFRGVEIAANLDQLHSDGNNLSAESALTAYGQPVPEGVVIPTGSQLDGGDFSLGGPFFCFGLSG